MDIFDKYIFIPVIIITGSDFPLRFFHFVVLWCTLMLCFTFCIFGWHIYKLNRDYKYRYDYTINHTRRLLILHTMGVIKKEPEIEILVETKAKEFKIKWYHYIWIPDLIIGILIENKKKEHDIESL